MLHSLAAFLFVVDVLSPAEACQQLPALRIRPLYIEGSALVLGGCARPKQSHNEGLEVRRQDLKLTVKTLKGKMDGHKSGRKRFKKLGQGFIYKVNL